MNLAILHGFPIWLTLITLWAITCVILTERVKHSLASETLPSRRSCFPLRRLACRLLRGKKIYQEADSRNHNKTVIQELFLGRRVQA